MYMLRVDALLTLFKGRMVGLLMKYITIKAPILMTIPMPTMRSRTTRKDC